MTTRKIFLQGLLSALILVCSFTFQSAAQTTPDPGLMGPHAVLKGEYDLGDLAYTPPPAAMFSSYQMEVRGCVHYPADIATSGPFPVLVWLHGRHSTCYNTSTLSTSSTWPCPSGRLPILSYEGYDYAARTMASHGYIVISISANSINAHDASLSDAGMNARGVLVQHHLDLWNGWNTVATGPFGSLFVGKLDMQNIGTMGHSRGGEGVIFNAEYNRSLGSPYGIKAVLTLAPVDFERHVLNNIPLLNIAPYCDGDVSDLQGVHFYDDSRFKDTTDETPKHCILVMGANHNFFNTVWTPGSWIAGGADDWLYSGSGTEPYCGASSTGTHRLDTTTQKAVYNAYAAAFYRYYIGHETQFAPILQAKDIIPPASSLVDSSQIFVSFHPGKSDRVDINRIDTIDELTTNTMGAPVTTTSLVFPTICGGGLLLSDCDPGLGSKQRPHRGTSSIKGLNQMRLTWSDTTAYYKNDVPAAYQDLTYVESISFRACENFSETSSGPDLDFTVQLIDSAGSVSSQIVNNHTNALFFEPGTQPNVLPKVFLNTIRIPISSFTGIDLTKVRHVNFKFNRSTAGAILISDLAFINDQCGLVSAAFTDTIVTSTIVAFTNSSEVNAGDTLKYLWNFGDPASGVSDTSTLQNPTHFYSGSGVFTACLYISDQRRNGAICLDTFCTTVIVGTALEIQGTNQIPVTIIPNPAKDYLQISGAEKTDVLKLVNVMGQEVFTTVITQPLISLPQNLPSGLYYAIVISARGNTYQKILINR